MTDYACVIVEFVLDKGFIMLRYRLVAARTRGRGVLAFQFEIRFIVVEALDGPAFKAVATRAVVCSFHFKLPLVRILVAVGAGSGQSCKLPLRMLRVRQVAGPAILLRMGALQAKRRPAMVEAVLLPPARRGMALPAVLVGIPFRRNLPQVDVLMAIHAALAQSAESPLTFLLVAGETGCGRMRAFQGKFGFRMVFQAEPAFGKTVHRMAFSAVGTDAVAGKLVIVVIGMAGSAAAVGQRLGHVVRYMAFPAVHGLVFSFEREARAVVVEGCREHHFPEPVFIVAFGALRTQFPLVDVPVAGGAVALRRPLAVLEHGQGSHAVKVMAFPATDLPVFAFEQKWRSVVIEPAPTG